MKIGFLIPAEDGEFYFKETQGLFHKMTREGVSSALVHRIKS
jgi:hypothetical protein